MSAAWAKRGGNNDGAEIYKRSRRPAEYGRRNAGICGNAYLKEGATLDYPVYSAAPAYGDMGTCQKILTAPSGRDTINTMEAPRRGEGRTTHEKADC